MSRIEATSLKRRFRLGVSLLCAGLLLAACSESGGGLADNGGIGGTGVSQGEIDAFGSIFVNGVRWDTTSAVVEIDGDDASPADLRVGMQVRVIGEFDPGGQTGIANGVLFDTALLGPVETTPIDLVGDGSRIQITILGRSVIAEDTGTKFGPGVTLAGLSVGQLLRVSGLQESGGVVRATRIDVLGTFPAVDAVEIAGVVASLMKNPDGSGIFDIDGLTIRYDATTSFSEIDRATLANGTAIEISGSLRVSGTEIDALEIEAPDDLFEGRDFEEAEISGVITDFVSAASFRVEGVPVDASSATLSPPGLMLVGGILVEVEGELIAGVLTANQLTSGESEASDGDAIAVAAAISAIDPVDRTLVVLGVTVSADNETELADERDGTPNFRFADLRVGDWIEVEGSYEGAGRATADGIVRKTSDGDVRLRGPVTALDVVAPTLGVAGRDVPLDGGTQYSNQLEQPRTEEEFFRNPGDVMLGDVVEVVDEMATDPATLTEADGVALD